MSWIDAARMRLSLLFARRAADARADEEIAFHIDMETDRLMRQETLSRDEANRRALANFGGVTRHKETLRDGHGLAWLGGFSLDMKLGFRMLRKYPGLTLVGGVAMAFAIWVGVVIFQVLSLFFNPSLPLPGGDRVVKLANWDVQKSQVDPRAVHEFMTWRASLKSVTDLGAYRDLTRNLITGEGDARSVAGAEITASAFRIDPTAPLLGRAIVLADEQASAPTVVVLGYDVWRNRFAADSAVVGRTVHLGETAATVVGVMPEGFAFPVAHELWTQLKPDLLDATPGAGVGIQMFGRLAPGVTLGAAQNELATFGRQSAAAFPATHQNLQARVVPYTGDFSPESLDEFLAMGSIMFFTTLLLVLVCSNVALLIFARAATRESELVVRSALGADRKRIVMQLFAEALVLGGVAALVGIVMAGVALRTWAVQFLAANFDAIPFWYRIELSPMTVAYALGVTVLAAVIAGVLPALKITRGFGARLKEGTAGGGVKFGGVWTAVIVAQVAVTVAFPSVIAIEQRELRRMKSYTPAFMEAEYLGVRLDRDYTSGASVDSATDAARRRQYGAALEQLRERVSAEPGVMGVTFVERLPRTSHRASRVEVDGIPVENGRYQWTTFALSDPNYFSVLRTPILAGRAFNASDVVPDPRVVIVDQAFIDSVMHGRNPISRRMRFVERPRADGTPAPVHPWLEIVGVVKDLGTTSPYENDRLPGAYLPGDLALTGTMHMMVHVPRDPLAFGPRLRELTASVDPMLRLADLNRLDKIADPALWVVRMWLTTSFILAAIAVLLSLAGIYAVLSYTVSRRTREIGVRVALGASRRTLLLSIFRRPLTHVSLGVMAGALLIVLLAWLASKGDGGLGKVTGGASPENIALLAGYTAFMFGVCLLACVVPTRRALSVEPTEALRAE